MEPQTQSPLLTLPAELRNTIYAFVLCDNIRDLSTEGHSMPSNSGLPITCKQLYHEAIEMFYHSTALKITTRDAHDDDDSGGVSGGGVNGGGIICGVKPAKPLTSTLIPKCYALVVPRLIFSHEYRRNPRTDRDFGLMLEDVDAYFRDIILERARGSGVVFKEVVVEKWFY